MAEALGTASGIVGFVGLAGQILQGLSYLHTFFQSIKDASEDITILVTEIAILRPLAERVEKHAKQCSQLPSTPSSIQAEIEPGLKYCADSIAGLEGLIKKFEGKLSRRDVIRKAGFVFASQQFEKHIARLERSKGYLMFAQTILIGATQEQHYNLSQGINSRLELLTPETISAEAGLNVETPDMTQIVLDSTKISELVLASMPPRDDIVGLEEVSPLIASTIQKAVSEVLKLQAKDWDEASRLPRPTHRSRAVRSSLKAVAEGGSMNTISNTHKEGLSSYTEQAIIDDVSVSLDNKRPEIQYIGTRSIIKTQTTWHQQRFWFGTLHMHGTRRTVEKEVTKSGKVIKSEEDSQTDIKFIPASWIFRKGAIASIAWATKNFQSPVISMGLQIFNVVAENSQIIDACRNLDLALIRRLFEEHKATPLDRDADGRILTDWAIFPMIERLADWKNPWVKELRTCFGVCRYLIDHCGLDPSQSQSHKWALENCQTAWTTLLVFQIRNRGHPDAVAAAPWFERLLRLLIFKARTNPFAQAKYFLPDVLELQARNLDHPIVDSSFSILAYQEMWSFEWDDTTLTEKFRYLDDYKARSFIEGRMIPAIMIASEAAAWALRRPDEAHESSRKWVLVMEKLLEDSSHIDDLSILYILEDIITGTYNFMTFCPTKEMSFVFKLWMQNILHEIMRYSRKRKLMDKSKKKTLSLLGFDTWICTDEDDVWNKIDEEFSITNDT